MPDQQADTAPPGPPSDPAGPTPLEVAVRREFFARVGGLALRYGVSPEDVLGVCKRHRPTTALLASRMIAHMEDLTVAAACLARVPLAWTDLIDTSERPLIRGLSDRLEEGEAVVLVRRWLRSLRRNSLGATDDPPPSLAAYPGVKPLRQWLGERLVVEVTRLAVPLVSRRLRLTGQEFGVSMCPSDRPVNSPALPR